jgi:sugar/nucleoside kinase (ribokinase family)
MKPAGIAIIGSTTVDKVVTPAERLVKLGGVTTYSGMTYRRHGINTFIFTNVAGKDIAILKPLQEAKIKIFNGHTPVTTQFINYPDSAEYRQEMPQSAAPIEVDIHRLMASELDFVHLGPLHAEDIAHRSLASIDRNKLLVILDAQGYVRNVRGRSIEIEVTESLSQALKISHIVKANIVEFDAIMDHFHLNLPELMAFFEIKEFIVTMGDQGGFVRSADGKQIRYPAHPISHRTDSTGAGDVFLAAYIVRRFYYNRDRKDASQYAAYIAGRQVAGKFISGHKLRLSGHSSASG